MPFESLAKIFSFASRTKVWLQEQWNRVFSFKRHPQNASPTSASLNTRIEVEMANCSWSTYDYFCSTTLGSEFKRTSKREDSTPSSESQFEAVRYDCAFQYVSTRTGAPPLVVKAKKINLPITSYFLGSQRHRVQEKACPGNTLSRTISV